MEDLEEAATVELPIREVMEEVVDMETEAVVVEGKAVDIQAAAKVDMAEVVVVAAATEVSTFFFCLILESFIDIFYLKNVYLLFRWW